MSEEDEQTKNELSEQVDGLVHEIESLQPVNQNSEEKERLQQMMISKPMMKLYMKNRKKVDAGQQVFFSIQEIQ